MSVPIRFVQGDSVEWTESLPSDYPATDWVLTYTFINASGKIAVVAIPDGIDYSVTLDALTTGSYIAGDYTWTGRAADIATGLSVKTLITGRTTILKDLSALSAYDTRGWAQTALDAVEAVIANRASLDQESYSIQGRSLSRTPLKELLQLRTYLQGEVLTDAPSGASTKKSVVRF